MLGTAVRLALAGRGAQLLQLVRGNPVAPEQLRWNPAASPSIADTEPLEGLEAAIHLSGASVAAHRWTAAYKREIRASRVESTQALAAALAGLRQPPKTLLVASATGIYGNRGDDLLDERSSPGTGFLADLCREWEAAAGPAAEAGIRVVHLRFGVVLGPGAGALAKMLPLFRLGVGGRLGSGHQWMSWISLADAVAAVLFALGSNSAASTLAGPVNLTAPAPVTNAEFTRALGRAVHRPAILPAPAFARLINAGFQFAHPNLEAALAAALEPAQ